MNCDFNDYKGKALELATLAHNGQVDKAGNPYIMHPMTVALKMDTDEEIAAAILHDVMEDSEYTEADIRAAGIPENVIDALKLLTHDKEVPYLEYVKNLKENPIARKVKLGDLEHNSDLSRLPKVTEKDLKRVRKYEEAMKILKEPTGEAS